MKTEQQLLGEAAAEIRSLRSANQLMAARLDMFDSMMLLLRSQPKSQGNCCMGEDVAGMIEQHLAANINKDNPKMALGKE
jgi:hypothetical protein